MPTPNLWQNPPSCHYHLYLSLLGSVRFLFFILTCNLLPGVLLCCICNISSFFVLLGPFAFLCYMFILSRSQKVDLVSFYFISYFLFYFRFIFHFSIFRTLRLGLEVICHTVTSVTSDGVVTTLITELKKRI